MKLCQTISSVKEFIEIVEEKTNQDELIILRDNLDILNEAFKKEGSGDYAVFRAEYLSRKIDGLKEDIDRKATKKPSKKYQCFYRGQFKSDYRLLPSIMRDKENGGKLQLEYEDYYYHMIRVQCAEAFQATSALQQLVKMQHYGCPTRLLDVTTNPLVALYFACKNFGNVDLNNENKGAVYVFQIKEDDILFYDSDRVKIISALAQLTYLEKQDLYKVCMEKVKNGGVFSGSKNRKIIERLYKTIRCGDASFEKRIDPMDVLSAFIVQPLKDNNRILKQDGAFIIDGLSLRQDECEDKLQCLASYVIPVSNQDSILKELDCLGINEATLFPEVDKVAHYLKEREF